MNYKVLYAEDESTLAQIICEGLRNNGYEVFSVTNGQEALDIFRINHPDICIFDIMMPLKDGYSLAQDIRNMESNIPIIFISAKSLTEDVIKGFKSGGNDYIRKPFNIGELLVRMRELLKRNETLDKSSVSISNRKRFGRCELNILTQQLKTPIETYSLSYKETALLEILLSHQNILLQRKVPLIKIWGDDSYYNARSMDVFMSHLRKMLKDDPSIQLMSIRGVGYKFIY